jgi:glycosyltransferase involved in cell wall biosynthesis
MNPAGAPRIEIIEPTLEGLSGHCHGLVASLCQALADRPATVWAGRQSKQLQFGDRVRVEPVFSRRWRLPQSYWLYRKLLREAGPLIITTAKSNDLRLLHLAARGKIGAGKVFLYFHWVRETADKRRFMQRIAARQPDLVILGTTPTVVEFFRACGFRDAIHQPYPMILPTAQAHNTATARHLLYAGAARQDKGFRQTVDLVQLLAERAETLQVKVQVSADHYGKYDRATAQDVQRLEKIAYPGLHIIRETQTEQAYADMFHGGICIQAYDRDDFKDRVSGVTLDALARGCPVVATSQTWIARLIEQYGAGISVQNPSAEQLYRAAQEILGNYEEFSRNALAAGAAEAGRSWAPLLERLERAPR